MKKLFQGILAIMLSQCAVAQEFLSKNEFFFSFANGLKLFVAEDAGAKGVSAGIVFNCGGAIEGHHFDGLSFLYEKILAERIEKNLKKISSGYATNASLFTVRTETSFEYVYAEVSSPENQLNNIFKALFQSVGSSPDSMEIARAVALSNAAHAELYDDPSERLDSMLGAVLWGEDYSKRLFISAWNDSTAATLKERLAEMSTLFFCPGNSLILVKGNFVAKQVHIAAKPVFDRWIKCSSNLLVRFPGYSYKLILNSSQRVVEDSAVTAPFYKIVFQATPTFESVKTNYIASLVANILADPGSKAHRYLKDSCHYSFVYLENEMGRYLSQLTFTAVPDPGCLPEGIGCFRSFLSTAADSLIDSVALQSGKEAVIASFRNTKANNIAHLFLVAKYWKTLSIDNYSTFEDTVNSITLQDVHHFLDTLGKKSSVTGLSVSRAERIASGVDSVFTSTATQVTAYTIHFLKNSAQFASAADDSVYNSLVQYLKLNPSIKVKINGMCHQNELLEVADEAIAAWVKSLDHFVMNPPSIITGKKFRLDVYRSITMIKKLTESGIALNRLFGTGTLMRSFEEDTEKYQIAGCSLMD